MNRTIDTDIHESFIFLRQLLNDTSYFLINTIACKIGIQKI